MFFYKGLNRVYIIIIKLSLSQVVNDNKSYGMEMIEYALKIKYHL